MLNVKPSCVFKIYISAKSLQYCRVIRECTTRASIIQWIQAWAQWIVLRYNVNNNLSYNFRLYQTRDHLAFSLFKESRFLVDVSVIGNSDPDMVVNATTRFYCRYWRRFPGGWSIINNPTSARPRWFHVCFTFAPRSSLDLVSKWPWRCPINTLSLDVS